MHSSHFLLAGLATLAAKVIAAPTPAPVAVVTPTSFNTTSPAVRAAVKRQSQGEEPPVTISDISPFQDPARWAQAVYCRPNVGDNVNGAQILWNAGDGGDIPHVFVAYHPQQNLVVLSHEGTNPFSWPSIKNDLQFAPADANDQLSRCVNGGSILHDGFQKTWQRTADAVLAQVRAALDTHPGARVLVTGHSLGAAIASIDSAWLRCNGIESEAIVFGSPRIGNFAFVSSLQNLKHLGNGRDPVIHLPPHDDEFYWASPNEYWQSTGDSDSILQCAGYDNVNCAYGVPAGDYDVLDHLGVYADVQINGSLGC